MLTFVGTALDIAHSVVKPVFNAIKVSYKIIKSTVKFTYKRIKDLDNNPNVRKMETKKKQIRWVYFKEGV